MKMTRDSDDEWAWWREAIKDPRYRMRTWAWLALGAAFVGDEEKMNQYAKLAEDEKALIEKETRTAATHTG